MPHSVDKNQKEIVNALKKAGVQVVDTISLTLPMPPSSNRYWRKFRNVMVKSTEARDYIETVQILAREANAAKLTGLLSFSLKVFRARRAGGLDNKIKIVADALQGVCYSDDKQIIEIHAYRYDDKDMPRVEVEIKEVLNG